MQDHSIFSNEDRYLISKYYCTPCKSVPLTPENQMVPHDSETILNKINEYKKITSEKLKIHDYISNKDVLFYKMSSSPSGTYLKDYNEISKIENYAKAEAERFYNWHIHHRLETRGFGYSSKELIALDLYYNRPASEFIFLRADEHNKVHSSYKKQAAEIKANLTKCLNS